MHWQDGNGVPSNEYFYNLKNVTFCGFHPRDHRYFGFITKVRVPACRLSRVTCHVYCISRLKDTGEGLTGPQPSVIGSVDKVFKQVTQFDQARCIQVRRSREILMGEGNRQPPLC